MQRHWMAAGFTIALALASPAGGEPFPPQSPHFISVDENRLLLGNLPRTSQIDAISEAQADAFFASVRAEGLEYRYVVGSCEDRAHFIAMMARKAGIPVGKVWAIAPARYTLLSRGLLAVRDPSGVTDGVTWGHHVAPVVRVLRDGEARTLVIDQTFSPEEYMTLDAWTGSLGNPRALFFASSVDDYLFNSLDGLTIWRNPVDSGQSNESLRLPGWMPNLLSGDFMYYNPAIHDPLIATGLAQDQLAMAIFTGSIAAGSRTERSRLLDAIKTESGLVSLAEGRFPDLAAETRSAIATYYDGRRTHWATRLRELR